MEKQKKILIISGIAILMLVASIGIRIVNMSSNQVSSNKNDVQNEVEKEITEAIEEGIVDSSIQENNQNDSAEEEIKKDNEESATISEDNSNEEEISTNDSDVKEIYVFKDKHSVKQNETLSDIVVRCLEVNNLEDNYIFRNFAKNLITKINDIKNPNMIVVGSELIIPTKTNFQGLTPKGIPYEVKDGDTIYKIVKEQMSWCKNHDKAQEILMTNNKIGKAEELKTGTIIYVPEKQDLQV